LSLIKLETLNNSITIEKPESTLDELLESFISALIVVGYDAEEIEKAITDFADSTKNKNN
jgi:Holliday junction resolvasome RuvABC DNA-binding subunit